MNPISSSSLPTPPADAFRSIDWGSAPDWLVAVGTIGAVAISIHLARRDGKRLELERREAAADRAEFRQQQVKESEQRQRRLASQVTLFTEIVWSDAGERVRKYIVHNGGDEPISLASIAERRIINDELSAEKLVVKTWPVIEAGGRRTLLGRGYPPGEGPVVRPMDRSLVFRDGLGQLWLRDELGALRLLDKDDPDAPQLYLLTT